MPGLTKCFYDVLNVDRKASAEDIKKAFRKMALQLHPDKNLHRLHEAKEEFQTIQRAYSTLIDDSERAWYDEHRLEFLRDDDGDNILMDVIAYCTSSCYSGFSDSSNGFYSVYREVFARIAADEKEEGREEEIPSFGDSNSAYELVVGPFYDFWDSYYTTRSFAWIDEYDTRCAKNHTECRLMSKENKKARIQAKKKWNQQVKALVQFVKRKDPRVAKWNVLQEELRAQKTALISKRLQEARSKHLSERQKIFDRLSETTGFWEKLEALSVDDSNDKEDSQEAQGGADSEFAYFKCSACDNKKFSSEQSFLNHEKSKKHRNNVEKMRTELKLEEEKVAALLNNSKKNRIRRLPPISNSWRQSETISPTPSPSTYDVEPVNMPSPTTLSPAPCCRAGTCNEFSKPIVSVSSDEDSYEFEDVPPEVMKSFFEAGRKENERQRRNRMLNPFDTHDSSTEDILSKFKEKDEPVESAVKKNKNKKKNKVKNGAAGPPVFDNLEDDHACKYCNLKCASRNALFIHLRDTGHSTLKPKTVDETTKKKKKKKYLM